MTSTTRGGHTQRAPFDTGSVSLGLHPPMGLTANEQVDALLVHARTAEAAGFDGVTVPEHHAGFVGYVPQPLLACSWLLAHTDTIWAAPCPLLLTLREPVLVAEQLAWTNARFPGRVAAAVAPGYSATDFAAVGRAFDSRIEDFTAALDSFVGALSADGPVGGDAAIAAWAAAPGPILRATNSTAAVRRAATEGLGVVFPGGENVERLGRLAGAYRAAGGGGAVVWIRNLWLGEAADEAVGALERVYRTAAPAGMRQQQGFRDPMLTGSTALVADQLIAGLTAVGATSLNVRFFVPGTAQAEVTEQIARFGHEVLPMVRAHLGASPGCTAAAKGSGRP